MPAGSDKIKAITTNRDAYSETQVTQCSVSQYAILAMVGDMHATSAPGIKSIMYMHHCVISMVLCCLAVTISRYTVDWPCNNDALPVHAAGQQGFWRPSYL